MRSGGCPPSNPQPTSPAGRGRGWHSLAPESARLEPPRARAGGERWGQEPPSGFRSLPAPAPPRPGAAPGAGKAQKAGSVRANNSAADPGRAAQASGRRGLGPVPAPPGRGQAGRPGRRRGNSSPGARGGGGAGTGAGEARRHLLGGDGGAGAAGVRTPGPGGRRRRAAAQLRAGLHWARTGTPGAGPAPSAAGTRLPALRPAGAGASSRGSPLPRRPHPVTSAASAPASLTLPPGTPRQRPPTPRPTCSCRSLRSNFPRGAPAALRPQSPGSGELGGD